MTDTMPMHTPLAERLRAATEPPAAAWESWARLALKLADGGTLDDRDLNDLAALVECWPTTFKPEWLDGADSDVDLIRRDRDSAQASIAYEAVERDHLRLADTLRLALKRFEEAKARIRDHNSRMAHFGRLREAALAARRHRAQLRSGARAAMFKILDAPRDVPCGTTAVGCGAASPPENAS